MVIFSKLADKILQEGYTFVNVGGTKLKMLAEKRLSDGTLQVVVIPDSPDIEFHYVDMDRMLDGCQVEIR